MNNIKQPQNQRCVFVIHEHKTHFHHYDLRLEIGGSLKSWVIPKGISLDPKDKMLALPTDELAVKFATFEGMLPEGEHGIGPMIVWDTGTYQNIHFRNGHVVSLQDCLTSGRLEFTLYGSKIQGSYRLVRFHQEAHQHQWMLVKMEDEYVQEGVRPTQESSRSALSGKLLAEVAEEESPQGPPKTPTRLSKKRIEHGFHTRESDEV